MFAIFIIYFLQSSELTMTCVQEKSTVSLIPNIERQTIEYSGFLMQLLRQFQHCRQQQIFACTT